jgi:hypothetical protein
MKSILKYYVQVIGVNLLAALVPILAVILIYGIGKLKNIYTHPCVLSQEIYDCCLEATIVVLAGFSVGLLLLGWADSWRKAKLMFLKMENCKKLQLVRNAYKSKMEVESIEERTEQKNRHASADSEFENISGLTVKEIYLLYQGREVLITGGHSKGSTWGRLAGYDNKGSLLYIGFTHFCIGPYSLDEINMMRDTNPEVSYVDPGYKNYDCYIPSLIRIYK